MRDCRSCGEGSIPSEPAKTMRELGNYSANVYRIPQAKLELLDAETRRKGRIRVEDAAWLWALARIIW